MESKRVMKNKEIEAKIAELEKVTTKTNTEINELRKQINLPFSNEYGSAIYIMDNSEDATLSFEVGNSSAVIPTLEIKEMVKDLNNWLNEYNEGFRLSTEPNFESFVTRNPVNSYIEIDTSDYEFNIMEVCGSDDHLIFEIGDVYNGYFNCTVPIKELVKINGFLQKYIHRSFNFEIGNDQ